jgi:hypothetical protein
MPHTSRRHRQTPNDRGPGHVNHGKKRVEITDDEGWTHVANPSTSTSNASRHLKRTAINSLDGAGDDEDPTTVHLLIPPAEAPPRLTLAELTRQFESHSLTWTQSATCERLHAALREETDLSAIERIVCIGLGSPSGLVRGGWVDRRSVALYQLSALVSVVNLVDRLREDDRSGVPVYAQDPVFNALDRSLLSSRAITVVDHPAAFTLVTHSTFLFCPGAERAHLDSLLPSSPAMVFGGPLEDNPSETLARWLATTRSAKVPEFAGNSHAFWHMRLYWRDRPDAGEEDDDDDNKVTTQLAGKRG